MTTLSNLQVDDRYQEMFAKLQSDKQGAFVPFVTLGDPHQQLSLRIIKTLIDNGADALELGIPYSDPSADGPTIQQAGLRALQAGTSVDNCIEILQEVRAYAPHIPIGLLVYANIIFARGIDKFYVDMKRAGVDSILIADVPMRESEIFMDIAKQHGVAQIFIAPPNACDKTLQQVADFSTGYTYVLGRAGVTGTHVKSGNQSQHVIHRLQQLNTPPTMIGFGISTPDDVKDALSSGAQGAISGSAVVNIIANNLNDDNGMLVELASFVQRMKSATKL
ncbi:tryptophan synthase subunit alpha [Thalassotalea maritima]|uniref:tryptophan synthase subunit alpha n=1 Tax=Thalassotalea maritima TaxID=3242416 RepID=UPI003528E318